MLRPEYTVSDAEPLRATTRRVGDTATAFSETSPKSSTSVGFRVRCAAVVSMSVQNWMFSMRDRSVPDAFSTVRMERQRRPSGALLTCH